MPTESALQNQGVERVIHMDPVAIQAGWNHGSHYEKKDGIAPEFWQNSALWEGNNMDQNELSFSSLTYLEAIYRLHRHTGSVHPVDLANDLQVSKPSVTRAIRLLADEGLVRKSPCGEIIMTEQGLSAAEALCEKCRALRAFLKQTIGLAFDPSCREIVKLSYSMSEEIARAIKIYLEKTPSADCSVPVAACL